MTAAKVGNATRKKWEEVILTAADLAGVQQTEPFLFLLNGWNEIAESNSAQANDALRELERDFPSAGIIVATRTHHLTPPLPGALRLRLLYLRRVQRAAYLEARLGTKGTELRARLAKRLARTSTAFPEICSSSFCRRCGRRMARSARRADGGWYCSRWATRRRPANTDAVARLVIEHQSHRSLPDLW